MRRRLLMACLATGLFGLPLAEAAKEKEVVSRLVIVRVVTPQGEPIPNAWVRIPGTEGRRMVDRNGEWEADMLYTLEGDELHFTRGAVIDFSISAPGYHSLTAKYKVRSRGNIVTVPLERMADVKFVEDDDAELMIQWFHRTAHQEPVPVEETPEPEPEPPEQ